MTFVLDDPDHQAEIESDNEQIIKLLKAIVLLLEVIASVDVNSTEQIIEE